MAMECYNSYDYQGTLYLSLVVSLIKHSVSTDLELIQAFPETPEDLKR